MSQMQDSNHGLPGEYDEDDIEQQLLDGLSLSSPPSNHSGTHDTVSPVKLDHEDPPCT
ncbi:hypothetical protein [Dictyobacter kobayashii]|uniref:Uncharacterized protein n=1 Tax=Dictyobacter kobayashii TaxID=2014872 RepID=A0A402AJV4_9CHLR|nr:hypothetical protein [Dictyobacter kobayashii]GCE19468.1 hypothetical protein KDK_32680 [Dictyobacter kobayashii]